MTALLVHPSRGKGDGQVNIERSLLQPVRLDSPVAQLLVADERLHLQRRHGDEARIWGTYRHNLKKYQRVSEGDPVLFTGDGGVWATARIGFQFRNQRFADGLWHHHPTKGVYEYLYSVTDFAQVDIGYELVDAALGLAPTNRFQAMATYEGEKAEAVIAALEL